MGKHRHLGAPVQRVEGGEGGGGTGTNVSLVCGDPGGIGPAGRGKIGRHHVPLLPVGEFHLGPGTVHLLHDGGGEILPVAVQHPAGGGGLIPELQPAGVDVIVGGSRGRAGDCQKHENDQKCRNTLFHEDNLPVKLSVTTLIYYIGGEII